MTGIFTIGHSTRTWNEFVALLLHNKIMVLVDVRRYPGSKRYPQFNKAAMASALAEQQIEYMHMEKLGGRRVVRNSMNTAWRNKSFRAYADYMATPQFKEGIKELAELANKKVAIMCSEAVSWRCHRMLITDYLTMLGISVHHIVDMKEPSMHALHDSALLVKRDLIYPARLGQKMLFD